MRAEVFQWFFFFFLQIIKKKFLAVPGLPCCVVFSLAVMRGLLIAVASLVVEHGL